VPVDLGCEPAYARGAAGGQLSPGGVLAGLERAHG